VFIDPNLWGSDGQGGGDGKGMFQAMQKAGWLTNDSEKAVFVMVFCKTREALLRAAMLPRRSRERPYVCLHTELAMHGKSGHFLSHATWPETFLLPRDDFLYSSVDLREYDKGNASASQLPGVTHPHPFPDPESQDTLQREALIRSWQHSSTAGTRCFLTFQGKDNHGESGSKSKVRLDLRRSFTEFAASRDGQARHDVLVNVLFQKQPTSGTPPPKYPNTQVFFTDYMLVPAGHGRWSYRLLEAMSGGVIPVVMADGLSLPFEQIIDWDKVVLRQPESIAKDASELLRSLPTDRKFVEERKRNVEIVYKAFFSTFRLRAAGWLRSLALWRRGLAELSSLRAEVKRALDSKKTMQQQK